MQTDSSPTDSTLTDLQELIKKAKESLNKNVQQFRAEMRQMRAEMMELRNEQTKQILAAQAGLERSMMQLREELAEWSKQVKNGYREIRQDIQKIGEIQKIVDGIKEGMNETREFIQDCIWEIRYDEFRNDSMANRPS